MKFLGKLLLNIVLLPIGVAIALIAVSLPYVIGFFAGWLIGHGVDFVSNGMITDGLNLLFNTDRFTDKLPLVFGTLVFLSQFLRPAGNKFDFDFKKKGKKEGKKNEYVFGIDKASHLN